MHQTIDGDYVIVYVQSIGGRRPPNEIKPTTERMVKIMPHERDGETSVSARQSFIRFNNHFRNIRELVFYPTEKSERVTLNNLTGSGPANASPYANDNFMTGEAGLRMATGDRSCLTFTDSEVDTSPSAHDDRMEYLFANTKNIRQTGSVISFGMVIKVISDRKKTGYQFCQIEFAAAEGDRVLIVAIKVRKERDVSSLYLKEQKLSLQMDELVVQRFIEVDQGYFTMKEYGKQNDDRPMGPGSHAFYNLDLGDDMEKDLFENYSHEVGKACLEPNQFNAGLFEEWREMIPPQTLDEHMKNIQELYTREALLAVGQLKVPRMAGTDNDYQNLTALMDRNDPMRRKLHIIRDAQSYVMMRRRDLEFERLQEYNFGKKIGPGLPRPRRTTSVRYRRVNSDMASLPCLPTRSHSMTSLPRLPARTHSMTPRPRTPALSHSSGSTTPTNSPLRRAQMVKQPKGKYVFVTSNDMLKEILDRLVLEPSFQRLKTQSKYTTAGEYASLCRKAEENMWNIKIPSVGRYQVSDSGGGGLVRPNAGAGRYAGAKAGAGGNAHANTVAGGNTAVKASAGGTAGARPGARANIGAQARSKAHVAVEYEADTQTGADTRADAGGDARANTVRGNNAAANTVATMDTGATVGSTGTALNAGADEDSDWSDDDEGGGVRLTPEPVNSEQELPPPVTMSKTRTLNGQRDSEPSLSTQESLLRKRSQRSPSSEESSPVKRSQNGGGGVSTRSVSPQDNSSSNDDVKVESGGGTPNRAPSPKKRKLSDDDDAAPRGDRSNITKLT